MKKTKPVRSLLAACSMVVISAVAYGCDSGPSQSDLDDLKRQSDAYAEAAAVAVAAAAAAWAEAEAAAAAASAGAAARVRAEADAAAAGAARIAAERQAAADDALRLQAEARAAAAVAAQAAAEAAQTAAEARTSEAAAARAAAETARGAAETARGAAETARGAAETARGAAETAQAVAEAAQAAAEAERDAALHSAQELRNAAHAAALKALLRVLADSGVNRENASGRSKDVHTPPAPMLSVSPDGVLMAEAAGYTRSGVAPETIGVWRGAMLSNADGDTAVVYSNIGNEENLSLVDRYESNLPTAGFARSWSIGAEGNAEGEVPWSVVKRPDEITSFTGPVGAPVIAFRGAVHRIPGTFSCSATASGTCRAPARYSDGSVEDTGDIGPVGDWAIVPDDGVSTVTDDTTCLTFGWWLGRDAVGHADDLTLIVTASDGLPGGAGSAAGTGGDTLRGSAVYKGAAAGWYALADTGRDVYEGDRFTARATVRAYFDADLDAAAAGNDGNGIAPSGTIHGFKTGDTARPDWAVRLMADADSESDGMQSLANLGAALTADAGAAADGHQPVLTAEWSTGGAAKGAGTWTARFHGGGEATDTALPMAATGTFSAHIGADDAGAIGRLQGAFGAIGSSG